VLGVVEIVFAGPKVRPPRLTAGVGEVWRGTDFAEFLGDGDREVVCSLGDGDDHVVARLDPCAPVDQRRGVLAYLVVHASRTPGGH
jgi:hypothetical protein